MEREPRGEPWRSPGFKEKAEEWKPENQAEKQARDTHQTPGECGNNAANLLSALPAGPVLCAL